MTKGILIFTALLAITSLVFVSQYNASYDVTGEYDAFIARYGRNLALVDEYEFRKQIFKDNLAYIANFNAQGKSWTLGVNKFADMTKEEVKSFMGVMPQTSGLKSFDPIQAPKDTSVNDVRKDWRDEKEVVRNITNQGSCGSCWAFAANEGVYTSWVLYQERHGLKATHPDLSEQVLVDCDRSSAGCQGGFMDNAYYYYTQQCPVLEKDYKYKAKDEDCKRDGKTKKYDCATDTLLGWYPINTFDDEGLRHSLNYGLVPVAIQAENQAFYLYEGGIIDGPECGYSLDHGVGLVAESMVQDPKSGETWKVWTIKNSWGNLWGELGYARIRRSFQEGLLRTPTGDVKGNVGVCGINIQNSFPVFEELWT
jgi:C1A family cysteine protease